MIAKISATENLGGALGYNFKRVEKEEASLLSCSRLVSKQRGNLYNGRGICRYASTYPRELQNKKMVFHCSLNPHTDEKLSDETLMQIAKEYMEALSYGKQPYIVATAVRDHL